MTATWGTTTTDDNATKRSGQAKLDTDKKDGYVRVTEGEGGNQNATNGEVPTRK